MGNSGMTNKDKYSLCEIIFANRDKINKLHLTNIFKNESYKYELNK